MYYVKSKMKLKSNENVLPFSETKQLAALHVVQNYINGLHWLLICPFRINFCKEANRFYPVCVTWQKMLVRVVSTLATVLVASLGILHVESPNHNTMFKQWTTGAFWFAWWLLIFSIVCTFNFQMENISGFLNHLQTFGTLKTDIAAPTSSTGPVHSDNKSCKNQESADCALHLSIFSRTLALISALRKKLESILSLIFLSYIIMYAARDSLNGILPGIPSTEISQRALIDGTHRFYFGRVNYTDSVFLQGQENYTLWDYVLVLFYVYLYVMVNLLDKAGFYLMILISCTTWWIVRSWIKKMKCMPRSVYELKLVLDSVDDLCRAFEYSRDAFGFIYCASCLGLIPMWAIQLPELFGSSEMYQFELFLNILEFLLVVFPAANVNAMTKSLSGWIQFSYSKINTCFYGENLESRMHTILQNINSNGIGQSGKLFMITYGFMGSVMSAVVTYSIIILQLRAS